MGTEPSSRRAWRFAGAAGLTIGLAAGGYGIASAASGTTTTAPPATSAPGASPSTPGNANGTAPRGRPGHPGFGFGMPARGQGATITAIAPDSITVAGPGGQSHQVLTDSSTVYRKDGQPAARSDLAVGQHVAIRAQRPASGSSGSTTAPTASEIDIISPRLQGTVSGVSGTTITITDGQGFTRTIHTSSATKYLLGGQPATADAVKAGEHIAAAGAIDANKTDLDAATVDVQLPRVAGTVQSISGNTITLTGRGGATQKVTTTSSTVYRNNGATASASDLKVGDVVVATGQKQADGSLAATAIDFGTKPMGPGHGAGFGGPGGPGFGGGFRRGGFPGGPGGPMGPGGAGSNGTSGGTTTSPTTGSSGPA